MNRKFNFSLLALIYLFLHSSYLSADAKISPVYQNDYAEFQSCLRKSLYARDWEQIEGIRSNFFEWFSTNNFAQDPDWDEQLNVEQLWDLIKEFSPEDIRDSHQNTMAKVKQISQRFHFKITSIEKRYWNELELGIVLGARFLAIHNALFEFNAKNSPNYRNSRSYLSICSENLRHIGGIVANVPYPQNLGGSEDKLYHILRGYRWNIVQELALNNNRVTDTLLRLQWLSQLSDLARNSMCLPTNTCEFLLRSEMIRLLGFESGRWFSPEAVAYSLDNLCCEGEMLLRSVPEYRHLLQNFVDRHRKISDFVLGRKS